MNGDACPTIRGDSEHDRLGCPDTDTDGWSDPMDTLSPNPWNTSQGADLFPADPARWNQSHVIDTSNSASPDGGLAAGIGLGALIAMMFVMVFVIVILKFRQNDEYEDEYEDEDEDDESRTSRAAEISRSWQEHGTAPPPPPGGAELITTASTSPPPPTAANTLPSASTSVQIPAAPEPPSEPLQSDDEGVMDSMDTNLAMSLLDSNDDAEIEEESESKEEASEDETAEDPIDEDDPWA
nr:hypothetical protein [Euryarchaeota archaeon]